MDQRSVSEGEKPRREPEIIPPGAATEQWDRAPSGFGATHRVYVAKVGLLGFGLIALGITALAIVLVILVVGAFLLWIPVAGLLLALAVMSGLFRRRPR